MRITVALTPRLLRDPERHAIAVVDVLRASTSLVTMFERGLIRAIVAETLRDARNLALRNFSLLCGERESRPLPGFDFGNSPSEFSESSFRGKSAVLWTTNGTRAIAATASAPFVAAGALVNRKAVAQRIVEEAARRKIDAAVVCAGLERGVAFSLEDTVAAGAIVEAAREAADVDLSDSAWAAMHLWRWYRGDAMRAFRHSAHGRALAAIGFESDLKFAAQVDLYDKVPLLFDEAGVKTMRLRPHRRRSATRA